MKMDFWSVIERTFGWGGLIAYHGVGDAPHTPVMHVSPARLRAQLEALGDRHHIVPLRELVQRWRNAKSTKNCVAITFDDAYAGVLLHALPILRDLDVPATVFVASDHAALGASYWWDDIERSALAGDRQAWLSATAALRFGEDDRKLPSGVDQIRQRVLSRFAGRWPTRISPSFDREWRSLRFSELEELAADDRIDFGAHTLSHPALPLLPYDEQVREMKDNFALLKERLPRVQRVAAYPYGLYDRSTIRAAQEAGMIAGLTMEGRATADRPDPMRVPRVGAGEIHQPRSLARKLNRFLRPAVVIRNRGRHPTLPVAMTASISDIRVTT